MNCAYCGKSAFLENDPKKLFCDTCRKMFLEDEIYLKVRELMRIEGEKSLENNLQNLKKPLDRLEKI